jgi:hypothetical protein
MTSIHETQTDRRFAGNCVVLNRAVNAQATIKLQFCQDGATYSLSSAIQESRH